MKSDNNILDLLDENKEKTKINVLDEEKMKKIFLSFIIIVLIICICFTIYGFLGKVEVPVANQTIYSRQQITSDMITEIEIPRYKLLKNDFIEYYIEIDGKYVAYNKVINKGDYFREDYITAEEFEVDSLLQVKDGYKLFPFQINLKTYNKNKVNQNEKVNLYFEYMDNNERKIGKIRSNLRVIDIRDNNNLSIFEPSAEKRIPEIMYLEVKKDDYKILYKYFNPEAYVIKTYYSNKELDTNASLTKLLEKIEDYVKYSMSKKITIDILNSDSLSSDLFIENIISDREDIIIKGTENDLDKVAIVKALVDLNKIENIDIGNITLDDIPLKAYSNTGEVVEVEIKPNTISVDVTISEKEFTNV